MKDAAISRGGDLDEEIKERAEIILRINKMHNAMSNWVRSYVSKVLEASARSSVLLCVNRIGPLVQGQAR